MTTIITSIGSLATGNVVLSAGHLELGDSQEIRLGDGGDLKIYHDGSNSILKENGTGGIVINNPSDLTLFNANVAGGVVKLFHVASGVSSEKLATINE